MFSGLVCVFQNLKKRSSSDDQELLENSIGALFQTDQMKAGADSTVVYFQTGECLTEQNRVELAGADVTTTEGLRAALPLFEPKHFIMPFLAQALGTFTAAYIPMGYLAGRLAAKYQ